MNLRIVNTCNNDCLYCLEQSYRSKSDYINLKNIYSLLDKQNNRKVLNFYWWNPLLHPNFIEIIQYAKQNWFENIGILTNSYWIKKENILNFKKYGLNSFGIYFNSFQEEKHNLIVWRNSIELQHILKNILLLKNNGFFVKIIIHINEQNIRSIYKDVLVLHKKYKINTFEFINYFPFDRPYNNYKEKLAYSYARNKKYIKFLFKVITISKIDVKFLKFSKDFFSEFKQFYSLEEWIIKQIWEEDIEILEWNHKPFCLIEKRCNSCFLKDKCKWYGL